MTKFVPSFKLLHTKFMDVKKAIKSRGKKIAECAELFGISSSALTQQIQNNTLTMSRVQRIAEHCGCSSVIEFLADEDETIICPHCGAKFVKIG